MSICLKISNVPSAFGALPLKEAVNELEPCFEFAWKRGVRMFWADQCASSQKALGMLLARLGEDIDETKLMIDLMSAERKGIFEYLAYITAAFDRLWVHSVDCVMVELAGGSVRKSWPPYDWLGTELLKRKLARGCGASLSYANQFASVAKKLGSVKRVSVPLKSVNRDAQPALKGLGHNVIVMIEEGDDQDQIDRLFTSGCVMGVDVLASKPAFVRKVVEGYGVA